MQNKLRLDILPQPDETACGPTCLHAVYRYFRRDLPLDQLLREVRRLENGGTLAVILACHALRRGFKATIYTYNVRMFDPTWFESGQDGLAAKLAAQARYKQKKRLQAATEGYLEFLTRGGRLEFEDLTTDLLVRHLSRGVPILTGLSATYLYRAPREYGPKSDYDDVRGDPAGHFVVLCGYDEASRKVLVADPLHPNPWFESHLYEIDVERVICSILLGIVTYDPDLVILEPLGRGSPDASKGSATDRGTAPKAGKAARQDTKPVPRSAEAQSSRGGTRARGAGDSDGHPDRR
ncbi:MAG: C39 family peptidase [Phycisphaeraceae bacterium]|nr:C39 family peptidase [Phycisphaeraceae bacterium]